MSIFVRSLVSTLALSLLAAPDAFAAQPHGALHGQAHGNEGGNHATPMKPATLGAIVVEQAWARASLTNNGAAYVVFRNIGKSTDRLIDIRSPVARRAELHTHTMDKGIMRMRPLKAIEVHPGAPAVMRPGGDHIMLMGLTRKLKRGERFPITLRFAHAGEVTVMVTVAGPGASGPGATGHKGHGAPKKTTH
ncbi:MAG TPA: copper chaperone PCu(A)C [Alphaproteobacteria bacterium]|nr:copper chaperone PCu(A)C [Alphaproteobacteria bacterium]